MHGRTCRQADSVEPVACDRRSRCLSCACQVAPRNVLPTDTHASPTHGAPSARVALATITTDAFTTPRSTWRARRTHRVRRARARPAGDRAPEPGRARRGAAALCLDDATDLAAA